MLTEHADLIAQIEHLKKDLSHQLKARENAEQLLETRSTDLNEASMHVRTLVQAMDVAADGIVLVNELGFFSYMNAAHANMFGYTVDELIGKSWRMLYRPKELQLFDTTIMPQFLASSFWKGSADGLHKDGSTVYQSISLTALQGGGTIYSTRDISQRRLRKETMQKLEVRLQQAEQRATVTIVSDVLAHDLNNIISAISGYAYLLKKRIDEQSKTFQLVDRISQAVTQAVQVVESLGSSNDERDIESERLNVAELIGTNMHIADGFRPKNINIEFKVDENVNPHISTSDILLSRCLLNMFKNAFESIPGAGKVQVKLLAPDSTPTIEYLHQRKIGDLDAAYDCIIEIVDNGGGMTEQSLNCLLNPLFTTKPTRWLRGLGMQSVKSMIDRELALIEICSDQANGSCFRLHIADRGVKEKTIQTSDQLLGN